MNEQDMMQKLKSDPRALKSVMQSADGRALLGMLSGGDTAALGRAAQQAASGDTAALSGMLRQVLSTPEGAALVQRLEDSLRREREEGRGMAELDEKLNALLSDPGSMAQIVQMAQQLSATMGGDAGAAVPSSAQTAAPAVPPPAQTPPGGIDPQVAARFLPLLQEYSRSNSQTMQLLYALRPFLKESKQDKVERAARLARLIHLGKKFLIDWGDGHV